jgi:uncharacterized membrane protein
MDQRRIPWGWLIGFVALLVVVGVVAYWIGASQPFHMGGWRMVPRLGFGLVGFGLPVLILALLVGLVVAALVPSGRRTETFEEWHRRAHADGVPHEPLTAPAREAPAPTAADASAPPDDSAS